MTGLHTKLRVRWQAMWASRRPGSARVHWRRGLWGRWLPRGDFIILLYGAHAHKLHRDDAGSIERRRSRPITSLSERVLVREMARFGVVNHRLSDKDHELVAGAF